MSQSKKGSLIEQFISTGSKFFFSLAIWVYIIVPIYEPDVTMFDNVVITSIFSVSSIIIGYIWRRVFDKWNT